MSKDYPTIQQHEPLRTPADWSSQGKRFIAQLEEILDDIYRRFNRLRLKDLDKSLQKTIVESEEGVAQLTVDVGSISGSVDALDGRVADVELTADGLTTDVRNAEGDITSLKQRADSIETNVRDAQGNISTLQQTASGLATRVGSAEGNISTLQQTASGLETRVQTAEGNITTVTQTANGLQTRVGTAEGNISTLQQTATTLTSKVGTAEGNISTLQQTASGLTTRVGTAEGNITSLQQTADSIELAVGRIQTSGSNLILDADKEVSNTDYNVASWAYFEELKPGEVYTFTICLTPAPQASVPYYRLFLSAGSQPVTTRLDGTSGNIVPTGTAKQILKLPFRFSESGYSGTNHVMRLYRPENTSVSNATTIHWAKLEKGTQTSDSYVPPPNGSDNLIYGGNTQSTMTTGSRAFGILQADDMIVGETYTYTVCLKPGSDYTYFLLYTSSGGPSQVLGSRMYFTDGTGKQVVSTTFVFPGYTNDDHRIFGYRAPETVTTTGTVYWAKLTKGVNREVWSPNPNEINNSSIKITNQGIDILTEGILNMAGGVEGSLLLPNGTITGLNGNFTNLSIGGQKIGAGSFLMPVLCKFTQGASSAPSGHGFLWFNASGTSYSTASRSGTTDVGYLPRTYTLQAPSNTLTSGTFTYTLTFGVVNRQNSNPDSISFKVTATINGVTFTSDTITLAKWQTQAVSITVTSTTNLFSSTSTLSVAFSSNWSGTSGLGPDLDGSGMTLTAQKSGTSGTQDVTVKYVP